VLTELRVAPGDQVDGGDVLAIVTATDAGEAETDAGEPGD
jgi:predicted deacylase